MRPFSHKSKAKRASAVAEAQSNVPVAGARLLGCCCFLGSVGLGKLATEALYAACRVYQALLAGKERVANRADFHVYVALMGRTGLKAVSAGALDLHCGVIGMNLFLGHLFRQTFPAILLLYGDSGGLAIHGFVPALVPAIHETTEQIASIPPMIASERVIGTSSQRAKSILNAMKASNAPKP